MHLAALAGAWLATVAGFGGMRDHGDRLCFAPRLPPRLSRLAFRLQFLGRRLRVEVRRDAATYELLEGEPIELQHFSESFTVEQGSPAKMKVREPRRRTRPEPPAGRRPPHRHDEHLG